MAAGKGMGGHQSAVMGSETWLTPPEIIAALAPFDLDPCCPPVMPWATARQSYCENVDGLAQAWSGRVWLNPPYGPKTAIWLRRLAQHGDGVAFVFARTETAWFFESVWGAAHAVLFLEGRVSFYHANGTRAKSNGGAPSCLIAYGASNAERLRDCGIAGHYVQLKAA